MTKEEWEKNPDASLKAVQEQAAIELQERLEHKKARQERLGQWVEKHHTTIRYCLAHNGKQELDTHPLHKAWKEMPSTPWLEDDTAPTMQRASSQAV